jgi:CHAT domain-containing protein
MKRDFTDFYELRKYLLRDITDEVELENIEMKMLADKSYLSELERIEADLIEEYLDGTLEVGEKEKFEKYFLEAPQRKAKFRFMLALKENASGYAADKAADRAENRIKNSTRSRGLFMNDLYSSGGFKLALTALLLFIIGGGLFWYLTAASKVDDGLASLKAAYRGQRPTEARLSAFDYAPLIITRGGEAGPVDSMALDKAGLLLINAVQEKPGPESYRALGLYYASLHDLDKALEQFDKGAAFAPTDTQFFADHGAVLLEAAKSLPANAAEKRMRYLDSSLDRLDAALKINGKFLPALFNRALCLQEMNSNTAAREAWQNYLDKDPSSKWAKEASDHLKQLDEKETGAKGPDKVLDDFLQAYDRDDPREAWRIAGESKEVLTGTMISDQLTRGLLSAVAQRAPNDAQRMLSALIFLGKLEKENTGDIFFSDLADYYQSTGEKQRAKLSDAQALTGEGYQLCLKSKYTEALSKFIESRKLFAEAGDSLEAAKTDFWVSYCTTESDADEGLRIAGSLADYSRARSYKWLLGQALTQTGSIYIRQSKFSPAVRSNKEALQIALDTSDTYNRQRVHAQLADVYAQVNQPGAALENSQNSMRISGSYYNSQRQAWRSYMFAAEVSRRFGLGGSAVVYTQEAVRLVRETLNDPGPLQTSILFLSAAFRTVGDLSASLNAAEESFQLAEKLDMGPTRSRLMGLALLQQGEVQRGLNDCRTAIDTYGRAIELFNESGARGTLKNYSAWKGKLLCYKTLGQDEKIEEELPFVLSLAEDLRRQIEEENTRTAFFSDEQSIYEFAAGHALKKGETELAFDDIEKSKARSLLDGLHPSGVSASPSKVTGSLSLVEIRRQLPAGSQLVQYAVLPDKLLIWVVTDSEVRYVEKNISAAEIEGQVREYMELAPQASGDRARLNQLSAQLYSVLLKPVEPFLNKEKTVAIIPDKTLCYLPFEALLSGPEKYAVEDFRISYAPSATLFVLLSQAALKRSVEKSEEHFLGVGNPAFDRAASPGLPDLPAAEQEIRASSVFYRKSKKFIGPEALKKDLLAALPGADVFHFAGHFVTNEISPQFSKFLLAGNSPLGDNDLTADEVRGLKLDRARLVVLSACKTAIENYYRGEGAIGASRTFFAAGVPLVVASRWEVDSAASAALITAFHRGRKEKGLSALDALRTAQIDMLHSENFGSPYYWAAFAAVGGLEKA